MSIDFTDSEVFFLQLDREKVILVKHVDDCLLAGSKSSSLLDFVSISFVVYHSTTTIILFFYRSKRSLTINQPNYLATLIDRFSVPPSTAKYPMCEDYLTVIPLHTDDTLLTPSIQTLFQEKLGSILYLAS